MSEEDIAVVRRHYEAFNNADLDGILGTVAEGVEFVAADAAATVRLGGERWRGLEEIRGFFKALFQRTGNAYAEVVTLERALADRIVATVYLHGIHRETHLAHAFPAVHVFTIADGLIVHNEIHHGGEPQPES